MLYFSPPCPHPRVAQRPASMLHVATASRLLKIFFYSDAASVPTVTKLFNFLTPVGNWHQSSPLYTLFNDTILFDWLWPSTAVLPMIPYDSQSGVKMTALLCCLCCDIHNTIGCGEEESQRARVRCRRREREREKERERGENKKIRRGEGGCGMGVVVCMDPVASVHI